MRNTTLLLVLTLLVLPAYAGGKHNGPPPKNTPPVASQGQLQGQAQGQAQGQLQGQAQSSKNLNANLNKAESSSHSGAISGAAAGAASGAISGSVSGGGSSSAGGGSANSNSSTGASTATIGNVSTISEGGQGGHSGDSNAASDSGDHTSTVSFKEDNDYPSAQAATVFAGYCQGGMSGQLEEGGFTVINNDQFCDYIRLAAVMREAYEWEMQHGSAHCADTMSVQHSDKEYADLCINEKAMEHLEKYRWNLNQAYLLVRKTKHTALLDRWGGQLIRPVALILAMILVI